MAKHLHPTNGKVEKHIPLATLLEVVVVVASSVEVGVCLVLGMSMNLPNLASIALLVAEVAVLLVGGVSMSLQTSALIALVGEVAVLLVEGSPTSLQTLASIPPLAVEVAEMLVVGTSMKGVVGVVKVLYHCRTQAET